MRSFPLALVALLAALTACGRDEARSPTSLPPVSSAAPPADAAPPATARPTGAPARGEVAVSFLSDTGGYWGPFADPTSDPADAVRPCYERALAADPTLVGWIRVRVAATQGDAAFDAELLDSSALPASLTACVVAAVRTLRGGDGGRSLPPRVAYVSLR